MYRGILIIVLFFFPSNIYSQSLSFIKEKIEMTVHDSNFTITGKYYFFNKSDREIVTSFYYPFVVNRDYLYPDSILILNENNIPINYSKSKEGVFFSIKTPPKDTSEFTAFYKQKNLIQQAEYILTTTQNWKKSLREAEYVINLPSNFDLKYISLKPDSQKNSSLFKTYYITKNDFMPKTNLIVEWGRSNK